MPDSPAPHRSATDVLAALKSEISNFKSSRSLTSPVPNAAPLRDSQSPDQPATSSDNAEIPEADLKPLYDFVQDCRACQAQLAAANANLTDEQARSAALARERNAAVTAAKGGGFWRQLKRNTKWLAIGAAVGVVLARAR
jgi:predicted nucleic acid-binding Zn ribbon protein